MPNLKTWLAASVVVGAALAAAAQVPGNTWPWPNFDPPQFVPPTAQTDTKFTGVTAKWPAAGYDQNLGAPSGRLHTLTYYSLSAAQPNLVRVQG